MSCVVGISGSPRAGGNTDAAVKAALEVIRPHVHDTKFLRIYDHEVRSCLGCRECMSAGRCAIQDDDVESLIAMLRDSSGAVIGAPVYWDGPPGRMKDFIDRSHGYYASRPDSLLGGLKFALISVATSSGFGPHEDIMLSWIEYYGARLVDSKRILAREKGDLEKRPRELEKAREAGRKLLAAMKA